MLLGKLFRVEEILVYARGHKVPPDVDTLAYVLYDDLDASVFEGEVIANYYHQGRITLVTLHFVTINGKKEFSFKHLGAKNP
jgi:hypothetical protein